MDTYPHGASPYGVLDMVGNVWEWTRSMWERRGDKPDYRYPYKPTDGRENLDTGQEVSRVLRGGAFYYDHWVVRCASRYGVVPDYRAGAVGFRVVMHP